MGTFSITIQIGDPQGQRFESIDALVDTEATLTTVPATILRRLPTVPVSPSTRDAASS